MTGAIHQFVPTFEPGAVGTHMRQLQRLIRDVMGRSSEIFAEHVHPALSGRARSFRDYGSEMLARPDDILVYQMAIGSVVADYLYGRREALVVNHHNLTPVRFLRSWDPDATYGVVWGEEQLQRLAPRAVLGLADSSYNEQQLQRAGFGSTKVVPVLMDFEALDKEADPVTDGRLDAAKAAGGADWLFVGRLAANKCQHLVVRAFAAYRRVYDPKARLWLVGGPRESRYVTALQRYIEALHLSRAVTLTGPVSDATLSSHYRHADVFVCLSEHEGFCVPLLEAMWNGVPVVALGSSAVPETVGDAGVVLPLKANRQPSAGIVAAAVHRVLDDSGLRNELTERGRLRVADFSFERTGGRFVDAFSLLEQQ